MIQRVLIFISMAAIFSACLKSNYEYKPKVEPVVISDDGEGTGTVTWSSNKEYVIDGIVFVNDGQVLTIEAGTVIKAKPNSEGGHSALVVSRGGKIVAEGTKSEPIIFTYEGDDLSTEITDIETGKWGGLMILGAAPVGTDGGEAFVEGFAEVPDRAVYGGSVVDDNSGVLRYVSIRYAGSIVEENNEINGLTLAGVGNQTTIEYVEVFGSADDGIEVFGGTVGIKNAVVAYCDDDLFDFELGYNGTCQFLLGVQGESGETNFVVEATGGGISAYDYTNPLIVNATFIGGGYGVTKPVLSFGDGAGGSCLKSVFVNQELAGTLEYTGESNSSFEKWKKGELVLKNNSLDKIAGNKEGYAFRTFGTQIPSTEIGDYYMLDAGVNEYAEIGLVSDDGISITPQEQIADAEEIDGDVIENVDYRGALGGENWLEGWSLLWEAGLVK